MVRTLRPYHANISKRQVKAPKVYVADSGILHTLLDIQTTRDLEGHPKVGASWEGFLLDTVVARPPRSVSASTLSRQRGWETSRDAPVAHRP